MSARGWRASLTRGCLAGFVGTCAMTVTTSAEQRLRPAVDHPIDYDASDAPVIAASRVLRITPSTDAQRRALFALVHWGYGSFVGTGEGLLASRLRSTPRATAAFYLLTLAMAFALLPALGGTPKPWRWSRDMLATSLVQHAVYAGAVGATDAALRHR